MGNRFVDPNKRARIDIGEGDWIEVPEKLSYEQAIAFSQIEGTEQDQAVKILSQVIKDWSLTLEDGQKAEITYDNIKRLEIGIVHTVMEFVTPMITVEKKS